MDWKRVGTNRWTCLFDDRFAMSADLIGDGRWSWKISLADARAPMATGIVSSPGAAKHAMESFLKKKGYL